MTEKQIAKPLLTEIPFEIKNYDIDSAGHVNNIVYVRWLEDLRTEMLTSYVDMHSIVERHLHIVVASTYLEYKKPLKMLDNVLARMWIESARKTILYLQAEFLRDDQLVAKGTQKVVLFNLKTEKMVSLPKKIVRIVEEYQSARTK